MADITNPQVVKFCNEKVRTAADLIEKTRRTCEQLLVDLVGVETLVQAAADKDQIDDGSKTDGRKVIAKENIAQLKFVVEQLVACLNTDDRAQIVARWSVNGQPIF